MYKNHEELTFDKNPIIFIWNRMECLLNFGYAIL